MKVTIQLSGVKSNRNLETIIQRKLQFSLSRVEPYINKISIDLISATNTRGVSNTHCRLTLAIANQSDIVIEDTQMDLDCVIDRVLQKANRIVERLVLLHK